MERLAENVLPAAKTKKQDLESRKTQTKSHEYKLISKIGHGAYGTVYKAQQLPSKNLVAIKIVEVEEDEFIEDYMTEIDLLQNLSHINIVKCLGFDKRENSKHKRITTRFTQQSYCQLFIFLEFCSKGSLRDMMSDKITCPDGYIPEVLCKNYIKQTLQGLKYLHEQGIIHRDIKCGNLLLSGEDHIIKLADFGISTKISHTLKTNNKNTNAGVAMTCIGSPNWMAPEILLGQGATSKSDIWSLGATLVEMLTGQPPFYNLNNREAVCYAIVHDFFIFSKKDRERLSSTCLTFVSYLFNKNIFQRPSAKDILDGKFIDNVKNSNWLFEEETDLKIKSAKLLKFKEDDERSHLAMFDEDFVIDESLLLTNREGTTNAKNYDLTATSLNLQNSPFKPKKHINDGDMVGQVSVQEGIDSMGRAEMIIEQFGDMNLTTLKILRLVQDIDPSELNKFILNKILTLDNNGYVDFNIFTYFKVLWGNNENLGIELAAKIKSINITFSENNGPISLIMYLKQLATTSTDKKHLLIKNWLYILNQSRWKDTIFTYPQALNLTQQLIKIHRKNKLDIIIWEFVLKLSHSIISKFEDFYTAQFPCLIDYLLEIDNFRNAKDLEMFQILFLKLTELKMALTPTQLDALIRLSTAKPDMQLAYFVLKVFNNILKGTNEQGTASNFKNSNNVKSIDSKNAFYVSEYAKGWLFESVIATISNFGFKSLFEFKFCRYFFELLYNLFIFQPSIKLALLENHKIMKICQRLTESKSSAQKVDPVIVRYHRYDLKLIIRLVSDLSLELNNSSLNVDLTTYKEYAYTSLLYLQNHITYSVYAIDILSNCTHKLLKMGMINFTDMKTMRLLVAENQEISIDLSLLLNGFIKMNFLQKNAGEQNKNSAEIKETDFDLVFKSVHKLLSALTITAKQKREGDENLDESDRDNNSDEEVCSEGYSTIVTEDSFANKSDSQFSLKYQYSPLSLFIVDNKNFSNIVKRIFDKYKGSLILQIEFLKFLKLLFKQYVGFRMEFYLNLQSFSLTSDGKNRKLMSYSILKSENMKDDLLPKRTANFKITREYLLTLWEESPKRVLPEASLSSNSSISSSPNKFLNIECLDSSSGFGSKNNTGHKEQERVGHNSIIIKTLVRDIDLIYKDGITLA